MNPLAFFTFSMRPIDPMWLLVALASGCMLVLVRMGGVEGI